MLNQTWNRYSCKVLVSIKRRTTREAVKAVWAGAYVVGALLMMAFILELAPRFSIEVSVPRRGLYALIGATLWPVILIGIIQMWAISAYAKRVQSKGAHGDAAREALSSTHQVL